MCSSSAPMSSVLLLLPRGLPGRPPLWVISPSALSEPLRAKKYLQFFLSTIKYPQDILGTYIFRNALIRHQCFRRGLLSSGNVDEMEFRSSVALLVRADEGGPEVLLGATELCQPVRLLEGLLYKPLSTKQPCPKETAGRKSPCKPSFTWWQFPCILQHRPF